MRALPAATIALLLAAACVHATSNVATTPTPVAAPEPAGPQALSSVFGSYRVADGRIFVIARLGWFFDMQDATYRTIYMGATASRFTIGPAYAVPLPKYGDLIFDGTTLTVATANA